MSAFIDLTKYPPFERLTAVKYLGNGIYRCRCVCGKHKNIRRHCLVEGYTRSCGCLREETTRQAAKARAKHGHCRNGRPSKEYIVWRGILRRCLSSTNKDYARYGGRGIRVCRRWQGSEGFSNFLADMGPRPSSAHTIERIKNNGNYSPGNTKWATRKEQERNKRTTVYLTLKGKRMCVAAWAEELGIRPKVLYDRVTQQGWSTARALTTPVRKRAPNNANQSDPAVTRRRNKKAVRTP